MPALITMLWREPSLPARSAPNGRDWILLGVVLAVVGIELAVRPELAWLSAEVLLSCALLPTLLWRRSHPFAMVAIAFGACTLLGLLKLVTQRDLLPVNTLAFLLLLPYGLFRWGSGRKALLGLPILLAAASVDLISGPAHLTEVVGGYAVLLAAMAIGTALRFRERAHERGLEQAKLEERAQLARDLHDTVAHHVSAIAIRAQAGLAVAATRPDAASEALRVIAAEASRTLTEMRAIVRVLRHTDAPELAPQPRIADIARLAHTAGEGPLVEVVLDAELDDLPASLATAIYRLAQESITNARKHARHATRIEVGVRADASCVRLQVSDDGESSHANPGAGYGLLGMAERALLLGGTCTAGPAKERGWTVTVVLPRAGATA